VDLKQELVNQALKLMQDPRVMRAMQNPKVMQGLMGALQLRAKVQKDIESQLERVAKRLSLATEAEVRELRRTVRRLEKELDALRNE
jgi:polyhydroxyalkanoate synthesis regulator phasin